MPSRYTLQHRSSLGLLGFLVTCVVAVVRAANVLRGLTFDARLALPPPPQRLLTRLQVACAVLINVRDVDVMAPGVVKKRGSD